METKNATIDRADILIEDHGILTCYLNLNYGGIHQSFGFHDLSYKKYGSLYIRRILETVGVSSWSDLDGKPVRVKCEFTKVHAIGHFIEDKWFNPEGYLK